MIDTESEWKETYRKYYNYMVKSGKEPLPYFYWLRTVMRGEQEKNK